MQPKVLLAAVTAIRQHTQMRCTYCVCRRARARARAIAPLGSPQQTVCAFLRFVLRFICSSRVLSLHSRSMCVRAVSAVRNPATSIIHNQSMFIANFKWIVPILCFVFVLFSRYILLKSRLWLRFVTAIAVFAVTSDDSISFFFSFQFLRSHSLAVRSSEIVVALAGVVRGRQKGEFGYYSGYLSTAIRQFWRRTECAKCTAARRAVNTGHSDTNADSTYHTRAPLENHNAVRLHII